MVVTVTCIGVVSYFFFLVLDIVQNDKVEFDVSKDWGKFPDVYACSYYEIADFLAWDFDLLFGSMSASIAEMSPYNVTRDWETGKVFTVRPHSYSARTYSNCLVLPLSGYAPKLAHHAAGGSSFDLNIRVLFKTSGITRWGSEISLFVYTPSDDSVSFLGPISTVPVDISSKEFQGYSEMYIKKERFVYLNGRISTSYARTTRDGFKDAVMAMPIRSIGGQHRDSQDTKAWASSFALKLRASRNGDTLPVYEYKEVSLSSRLFSLGGSVGGALCLLRIAFLCLFPMKYPLSDVAATVGTRTLIGFVSTSRSVSVDAEAERFGEIELGLTRFVSSERLVA